MAQSIVKSEIPRNLPPALILKSGSREKNLLKMCAKYSLTLPELEDLVFLKREYETNFPTLINLGRRGYSTEEIQIFFDIREAFAIKRQNHPDIYTLSIAAIIKFWERFDKTADASCIIDAIESVEKFINEKLIAARKRCLFTSQILLRIIEVADKLKLSTLQEAVETIIPDDENDEEPNSED